MTNIRINKEKISIHNIGRLRFWIGLFSGLISAISISLFFNHSREALRLFTSISGDLLILKDNEVEFFDYFFSSLSTVLGLSITIWIWMQNKNHNRGIDRFYKKLSISYALLIFWLILMIITRFGTVLLIVLLWALGYDNHLSLYDEFWLMFVLIPIVVFMQSWLTVRLVYQARKWILFSVFFCILIAFALSFTTTANQEAHNREYHQKFEKDYNYIDKEINNSKAKYGIDFDKLTVEILKKQSTESSFEQIEKVKKAFSVNKPVTMDTIILQKIIIRNYKEGRWYRRNSIENWHYALPTHILKQLDYFDKTSNETTELFEILKEIIDLVNTPEIKWENRQNYTKTERRRSMGAKYNIPDPLIDQLKKVRTKLLENNQYSVLSKKLAEIKEREYKE